MQVMTPSTISRLPTIDLAISARRSSMRLRKRVTCSRMASVSDIEASSPLAARSRPCSCWRGSLVAGANQLEVALHVESVPAGDLVLGERLLGHLVVLGVDLLVAARREAALGRAEDDLAAR